MSIVRVIKSRVLPNRIVPCRILCGPFRGARISANPQHSLRYMLGVYEHELNSWIREAIPRAGVVLDVGANYGYFSCGVMAAWKRLKHSGTIIAFEPHSDAFAGIKSSASLNASRDVEFVAVQSLVGRRVDKETTSLDVAVSTLGAPASAQPKLIKIDVEGAELDVLFGAESLVADGNLFLVEAHSIDLLHEVERFFSERSHAYCIVRQKPMWWLRRENRAIENFWVVSKQ